MKKVYILYNPSVKGLLINWACTSKKQADKDAAEHGLKYYVIDLFDE